MLQGLNHITLAVRDLQLSLNFYIEILGFRLKGKWSGGAYLTLGDLWLCLYVDEPQISQDYSHIAFTARAEDYPVLAARLQQHNVPQWQSNKTEGSSLYILDPDSHRLEIHVGNLKSRLEYLRKNPPKDFEFYE